MNQTQLDELRALLARAEQNDKALNDADMSPDGDNYNALFSLVQRMARLVPETVSVQVRGKTPCKRLAAALVAESVSFNVEPCGDAWEFTVKREHARTLNNF